MEQTSRALTSYWSGVLSPLWERVTDITNADISYRSRALASEGVGSTLTGLHKRLSYREGRLRLQMPGHHEHRSAGVRGCGSCRRSSAGPAWSPSRTRRRRW